MLALITATLNSEASLKSAISSIEPVIDEIKHVVIDGRSSDRTLEILEEFGRGRANVRLLQQKERGLYEALNQALEAAMADAEISYIGFLHSDDHLVGDAYAKYLSAIKSSDADICYSDIQYHTPSGNVARVWRSGKFSRLKLNTGWMPPHTSIVAKKSVYERFGLFNPAFGTAADYEWVVRVLSDESLTTYYHPATTVSMQTGGASNASFRSRLRANAMDGSVWRGSSVFQASLIRILKPARKIGQFFTNVGPK